MTKLLGAKLPEALLVRLAAGRPLPGRDVAVPVCSVDAAGWPHPALLSYEEIEALGPSSLRVRVYAGSSTAANLRREGHLTLLFIDESGVFYVKARARQEAQTVVPSDLDAFVLDVSAVLADAVDTSREPDARVTSGIRFRRFPTDALP
jgi:hypothetical protein